jgi:protein subunit release factor A
MPGENLLQTLQRYATIVQRLDDLAAEQREFTKTVAVRLDKFESQLVDIRERLARLEASRSADRAEMQADIARFKAEVERAEFQLTRLLSPPDEQSQTPARPRKRAKTDQPEAPER